MQMDNHVCCTTATDTDPNVEADPVSQQCSFSDACTCTFEQSDHAIMVKDQLRSSLVVSITDRWVASAFDQNEGWILSQSALQTPTESPPIFLLNRSFLN